VTEPEERALGRVVLVTGASTGIGRATAVMLARSGYSVLIGVRRLEDADAVREAAGGEVAAVVLDLTDEASLARAASEVERAVGERGLYGLVNNAGIAVAGPLEFVPMADLRRQMEVNVLGQVALTQAMMPLLRRCAEASGAARVVFVGSVSGMVASRLLGPYASSKFALRALADTLRRELEPWPVGVSLVEPGRVRTPIWQKSREAGRQRLTRMPEGATRYYGETQEALLRGFAHAEERAVPPEAVGRAVARALAARLPRARYRVGADAVMVAFLARWCPDPWLDRLMRLARR
jgi:NAD(P)-dependent dehydrogenase (short-subunit alcohol dehydrogenase family)